MFGVVLRARHIVDDRIVAIKKVRLRRIEDGLPKEVHREVMTLQALNHPNVVSLHAVFPHGSAIVLVFDDMKLDLQRLMAGLDRMLYAQEVKSITWRVLQGLAHCHENGLMHRDIKTANILVGHDAQLVIADFGLARVLEPPGKAYSLHAATRWYRAPELLFGARVYDTAIDVWSFGICVAELLNGIPPWRGENDIDQLSRIQTR